jgi:serine/threonine protein kinase
MSPEQATGDQAIGPSADIYALACMLFGMLVGEPPYLGNTAQEEGIEELVARLKKVSSELGALEVTGVLEFPAAAALAAAEVPVVIANPR